MDIMASLSVPIYANDIQAVAFATSFLQYKQISTRNHHSLLNKIIQVCDLKNYDYN